MYIFFFKQKTAYEMRISDWSSDVCSSDLTAVAQRELRSVGRTDAELVFKPHQFESRHTLLDHERFDRSTAGVPVERRPDHHQFGAITRGNEDLVAVQHVVITI